MAKTKPAESASPSPTSKLISTSGQKKLEELRRYHAIGRRAMDANPDGTAKEAEPIKVLAAEAKVGDDTIRKAKVFAKLYGSRELEDLLSLRRPNGEPLSWYLIRPLLQVVDRAVRADLQSRTAREGWSRRDLRAEIQTRQGGKHSRGGRPFVVPIDPLQIVKRLAELGESWIRLHEEAGGAEELVRKLRDAKPKGKNLIAFKQELGGAASGLKSMGSSASHLAESLEKLQAGAKGRRRSDQPMHGEAGVDDAKNPSDQSGD